MSKRHLKTHFFIIAATLAAITTWLLYLLVTRPDVIEGSRRALNI